MATLDPLRDITVAGAFTLGDLHAPTLQRELFDHELPPPKELLDWLTLPFVLRGAEGLGRSVAVVERTSVSGRND